MAKKIYIGVIGFIILMVLSFSYMGCRMNLSDRNLNYNFLFLIGIIIVFITSVLFIYVTFYKKVSIEKQYLVVAIGVVTLLLGIQTPMYGFDEMFHVDSAYVLSNMMMGQGKYVDDDTSSYYRRNCDEFEQLPRYAGQDLVSYYEVLQEELFEKTTKDDLSITQQKFFRGVPCSPLTLYFPQAVGMTIARLLGLNGHLLLLLARICTIASVITIIYFAIKNAPIAKELFFIFGLMPMTLMQGVTLSRDALLIPLGYYFISKCLQITYCEKEIKIGNMIWTLLTLVLLVPNKMIYLPICVLLLLPILKKFSSVKIQKKHIILCTCGFVLLLGIYCKVNAYNLRDYIQGTNTYSLTEESPYTIQMVMQNPVRAIGVVINTFRDSMVELIFNMIAPFEIEAGLSIGVVFGFIILMLLSIIKIEGNTNITMKLRDRLIIIATYILVFLLCAIGFLLCTPHTNATILGIQGRYITPVLPLLFLAAYQLPNIRLQKQPITFIVIGTYILNLIFLGNMLLWTVTG